MMSTSDDAVIAAVLLLLAATLSGRAAAPVNDPRHISNGHTIPGEDYCDQPYVVKTGDGAWLCVMTTARGAEGAASQHVITTRSTDQGRTWSAPVDVEPPGVREASYAVLQKALSGRVYVFYNYNRDNVREVKREDGGVYSRVDSLGAFVFKFSDDHGRTWSARRYEIPVREFACDRENVYGGRIRFFWNVGRPIVHKNAVLVPLHKVGAMGKGFFAQSEGAFLRSANLLTERDPEKIVWETLPDGDQGLRTPTGGGRIAEEQSVCVLSDGSLYCVYRTVDGHPASAYSRDGGRTWTRPEYASYKPGGRRFKHPRAANFVWRCANGKYLYWFHNHGGSPARKNPEWDAYADRNPAWICAGEERDSPEGKVLHWSQPEILLYDDDPFVRMSYPDLIEQDGRFWITETQKHIGRVHELPAALLAGLFAQSTRTDPASGGLILDWLNGETKPARVPLPRLPPFLQRDNSRPDHGTKDLRAGFTLDLRLELDSIAEGQVLIDNRAGGRGFVVSTARDGALRITMSDGRSESGWESDPGTLRAGAPLHAAIIVDGGPKIIGFVIEGVLDDGGDHRQFGWGRFSPALRDVNGSNELQVAPAVKRLRIYSRALRTSEAVANYRAGMGRASARHSPRRSSRR